MSTTKMLLPKPPAPFEVIRFPKADPMVAYKDLEDEARQVAAWVMWHGGEVEDFTPEGFTLIRPNKRVSHVTPGIWVAFREDKTGFFLLDDEKIEKSYLEFLA